MTDAGYPSTEKTIANIMLLYNECGSKEMFGRTVVENITTLKASRASELIKVMLQANIIEPITGYGKGKYHFKSIL